MKTDLLFWTKFPNLKILDTKRLIYGNHKYRLEVEVLGGRVLTVSSKHRTKEDFIKRLAKFVGMVRNWQTSNVTWAASMWKGVTLDTDLLKKLDQILIDNPELKVRIEMSHTNRPYSRAFFSSPDLSTLKKVVALFSATPDLVKTLSIPKGKLHSKIENGAILCKRPPKYKYRVTLKPTSKLRGDALKAHRNKIMDMIKHLDDVHISDTVEQKIRERWWYGDAHIYTNDPTCLAFVQLVDPYIVGKISPMIQISE